MARPLSIEIDSRQVENLAAIFGATEDQVLSALRSTFGKMGRWLRTRSVRGLSEHLAIQQKILRQRVKAFRLAGGLSSGGDGAKVWFGLKPIPLIRLNAREVSDGVRASGGRHEKGAFIARIHGRQQVLRRKGKERVPLEVVKADISEPAQVYIEDRLIGTAEFDDQFFKILDHELKWRTRILK